MGAVGGASTETCSEVWSKYWETKISKMAPTGMNMGMNMQERSM
jgi:hypothetical protein